MYLGTHQRQLKVGLATFQKTRTLNLAHFLASSLVAMTPWLAMNWFTSVLQHLTVYVMSAVRWVPPGVLWAEMGVLLSTHTWHPPIPATVGRNCQLSWWRQCVPLGIRWDLVKTRLAHKVTIVHWYCIFVEIHFWPIFIWQPLISLYTRPTFGLQNLSLHFDGHRKVGNGQIFIVQSPCNLTIAPSQCVCQVSAPGSGPLLRCARSSNEGQKIMYSWKHYIKLQPSCT